MLVVGVIVVAALLLSMGSKGSAAPPPPPPEPPKVPPRNTDGLGGGSDFGKVAPAIAGTAGSLVTLGGTILAAVGGHGTAVAAGGGTAVAGGTLAEVGGGGVAQASGGGTASGAAAESTVDAFAAVTVGSAAAEAAVVGGIGVLVALAMLEMYMFEQVAGTRNYWARVSNKPSLYYSRWYNFEETAVQNYLDNLSKARGAQVAYTKRYADVVQSADGVSVELHRYYVDSVQDPQALRELPAVRAVARWFAVKREYAYHRAVLMFWASIGRPPGVTDTNDLGDIAAGTNAAQPAMTEEAFWALAGGYLQAQPMAANTYEQGSSDGSDAQNFSKGSGGARLLQNMTAHSFQPQGQLPEHDFDALEARAGRLLGSAALDATKFQAHLRGSAHGMTLAAVTGYQLLYPGDEAFTLEVGRRCGVLAAPYVFAPVRTSANEIRPVMLDSAHRYGIDVARSRFRSVSVIYSPQELQL